MRRCLSLYEQARDICRKVLGETHPLYALSLNNLAEVYRSTAEYDKALPLYEQARDIYKKVLGETHPDYATTLYNLAALYHESGDGLKAARLAHQALLARVSAADTTFAAQNSRLRLQLLADDDYFLDRYLSVALPTKAEPTEMHGHVLAWKGMVPARSAEERLALQQPELAPLLQRLRQARAALSQVSQSPPRDPRLHPDWITRIREREGEKDNLETQLAVKSAAFRRTRASTSAEVAAALPADAAFVDILEYRHLAPSKVQKGRNDLEPRFLAFVLRQGGTPVVIELGKAQPIDEAVAAWRQSGRTSPTPDANARKLAELVWQPIRQHLGTAKAIYLSPDGSLARFPFAALPGSKPGSFLLEDLAFVHVTSGRHLLEFTDERHDPRAAGLLAVGALDFGQPASADTPAWGPLPGTRLESERVAALFEKDFPTQRKPLLLSGADIDVARLAKEVTAEQGRWRFLHLATHGFFLEPRAAEVKRKLPDGPLTQEQLKRLYTYDRNPLLSSGLVLSGGNSDPGKGTLTAEQVLGWDLRGVEVTVLSACETGLGKVSGSQGVQGLQLAFHCAGVRTLVAGLWQVNDAATSVLMEEFYTNLWHKKLSRAEALRQAQLAVLHHPDKVLARRGELRELLAKRGVSEEVLATRGLGKAAPLPDGGKEEQGGSRRSSPDWWAAFLLSGDPGKID
jgi:CHAT domain-containing protein